MFATDIVSSRLDYCNSPFLNIALKGIMKCHRVQNCMVNVVTRFLVSLTRCHFLNHCIGSLSEIALFLRSAQFPIKHFHPSKLHIHIYCSLLQNSPDSFDHLVLIHVSFRVLRQTSVLELYQMSHQLRRTHSLLKLNRQDK